MAHKKISQTIVTLHLPAGVASKDAKQIMDNAVDRLADIQLQKHKIAAEEEEIRARIGALMGLLDLKEHLSQSGHKATMYDSKNVSWSAQRLQEILTEEEQKYCRVVTPFKAILIS